MKRIRRTFFNESDVIGFLETKIQMNIATKKELLAYENYTWNGKLNKRIHKELVNELVELHKVKF